MAKPRIKINRRGYGEVMKSRGVRDHLRDLGSRVLTAANATHPGHTIIDDTSKGGGPVPPRGVVRVAATDYGGRRREADTGYLSSALDRARGGAL